MSTPFRLYTDFVCPFCFIAEESTVPRLLAEFDLELDWCGFELHPDTPRGGRPLSELFGSVDFTALHARTRGFGASFGLKDFNPPSRLQNTRRALAMAEFARTSGALAEFRRAAFDGHFRKGWDLEADQDLLKLAAAAGLNPEEALGAADNPDFQAQVDARQEAARQAGVRGIPTFVIGTERVIGCQPYPVLKEAALRAGAKPR